MISFIITAHNESDENLFYTLNNLISQVEHLDSEIIVIDNGENEFIKAYIPDGVEFQQYDSKIGSGVARQQGYKVSQGDKLFYLDSHVLVDKSAIDDMVECLDGVDIVHIAMERFKGGRRLYHYLWKDDIARELWGRWSYQPVSDKPYKAWCGYGFVGMKRSVLDDIGGWYPFEGYGGCEQWVSFLSGMQGKTEIILPNHSYVHYSNRDLEKQAERDFMTFTYNTFQMAYMLGGEKWARQLFPINTFHQSYNVSEAKQEIILDMAIKARKAERREIVKKFGGDLDKLFKTWRENGVFG